MVLHLILAQSPSNIHASQHLEDILSVNIDAFHVWQQYTVRNMLLRHISAESVIVRLGDVHLFLLQLTCSEGSFWWGAERTTAVAVCGYRVR